MLGKFVFVFLLAMIASCLADSVSYNQFGDIRISYDGQTFVCDRLTCPREAERCIVTKRTLRDDRTQIERFVKCLDGRNEVVLQDKRLESNPHPNSDVDAYVEHSIRGSTRIGGPNQDGERQRMIQNTLHEVQRNIQNTQLEIQRQFERLRSMFSY